MSHIAQLRAMLAELESTEGSVIQDLTDDFRRNMLPKMKGNAGAYNRFFNLLLLLDDEYGDQPIGTFGPKRMSAIRQHFIKADNCRRYVNEQTRNVIRIFKYGVVQELVEANWSQVPRRMTIHTTSWQSRLQPQNDWRLRSSR